MSVKATTDQLR